MPGSEILPFTYSSSEPRTKTAISPVDIAPRGAQIPIPLLLIADLAEVGGASSARRG